MDTTFAYKKTSELLLALLAGVVLYLQLRALDIMLAIFFLPETKENFARAWRSALSLTAVPFSCIIRPLIEEFVFRRKLYECLSRRFTISDRSQSDRGLSLSQSASTASWHVGQVRIYFG